jgi:hypothetical protein
MTQVLFSALTAPQLTDLDANFTELYGKTAALVGGGSGRVGINKTPTVGVALDVNGYGIFGQTGSGFDVVDVSSTNSVNMRIAAAGSSTIASAGTTSNHPFYLMTNNTERARLDVNGRLLVGQAGPGLQNSNSMTLQAPDGYCVANHTSGTASGTSYLYFGYNGSVVGTITQNGTTAVAYNTTSDYRLKSNAQSLAGSGAFIDALKPKTWVWAQDGSRGCGFLAHEFAEVSPASVIGAKDAIDAEGAPIYQAMDASTPEVIANIVAELQDLRRRLAIAGIPA